jgi:uncharacterized protein YjiS (DUF1127 family)
MTTSEDRAPTGVLEAVCAAKFISLLWATVARAFDHRLIRRFKISVQLDRDVSELGGMTDRELRDLGIDRMDIAAIRAGTCKRGSTDAERIALSKDEIAIPMDGGIDAPAGNAAWSGARTRDDIHW